MKLDDLEADMDFKVLALKNFCLGHFKNSSYLGDISEIEPHLVFNNGIHALSANMYSYDDFMLAEMGSCGEFRDYLSTLEKIHAILQDCPFIEIYKCTNTFIGNAIIECLIWWETNIDLVFRPHLTREFFKTEVDQYKFQAMHLKMLELFRFCSQFGFMQLATKKDMKDLAKS
jgi:hypothetical protein